MAAPGAAGVALAYSVALGYPVADRTSFGALALAYLGLSSTIPTLGAAFFSGALADRYDRGVLMRIVNLTALLAVAGLVATLVVLPGGRVPALGPAGFYLPTWVLWVYPLWAAFVVSATLFRPAFNTSVPRVVPPHLLGRANGLIYSVASLVLAGSTLGVGGLLTVAPAPYALGVSFLLLFLTQLALLRTHANLAVEVRGTARSLLHDAGEGFSWIGRHRAILQLTISGLVANFLVALATVELVLYVTSWLGLLEGVWYGAMVASATIGSSVGLLVAGRLRFEPRAGRLLIGLIGMLGLTLVGLALVHSIWLALGIIFLFGVIPGILTTVFLSTIQSVVPDQVMGRVFSADEVGSYALTPVGQFAGGLLTVWVGVQGTYLISGGFLTIFGAVMFLAFASLRQLSYVPRPSRAAGT